MVKLQYLLIFVMKHKTSPVSQDGERKMCYVKRGINMKEENRNLSAMPAETTAVKVTEEAGYNLSQLDVLDNHIRGLIERKQIQAGAYIISLKGRIIAHKAIGNLRYNDAGSHSCLIRSEGGIRHKGICGSFHIATGRKRENKTRPACVGNY